MNDEYLSHEFNPKYVAKVGKWPHVRYFYSQKEYQNYLKEQQNSSTKAGPQEGNAKPVKDVLEGIPDSIKNKIKKRQEEQEQKYRQHAINYGRREQDHREQAIMKSRADLKEQERKRQEAEKADREEKARQQEEAENAVADIEKKKAAQVARRKLPDEVSLKDYLFGGQFKKELKSAKKNMKNIQKELKQQKKEAARLDARIKSLSDRYDRLSGRSKQKLERLQAQREELQASIVQNNRQRNAYYEDYTTALYRYEGATMLGRIGRKMKNNRIKASSFINKYSKTAVSSLPAVKLKRKK
jgi:chromosome segregation ATPase